jgi:hypothetical protein
MTYLTKKEIKLNTIYDIEYKWASVWLKGWGRLTKDGYVNVITLNGGVNNVPFDDEIRFIKLTNVQ